jgi:hypothetical protein
MDVDVDFDGRTTGFNGRTTGEFKLAAVRSSGGREQTAATAN